MTHWFTKHINSDFMPSQEEEGMALVGSDIVPDWVRLPEQLGGEVVRCIGQHIGPCPDHDHIVRHLDLEGEIQVAECPQSGYLWYIK